MGIEDIQISEELETNAPSIKYSGNEGPKSPQEEKMMMADAMLKEEYNKYVFDLLEIRPEATPMTIEEFRQMIIAESQMSGGQPLPSDPTKPVNPFQPKPTGPVLPDRQMAAYGGIMGMDGRRQYGIGSFLKKKARKLIPNEIAAVAEKAAPFVAPFNPLAAGLMKGIGGFDRTGSIGDSLKSGLMTYGLGQGARYLGGADFQGLQNPFTRDAFSSPIGTNTGIGKFLDSRRPANLGVSGADKAAFTSDAAYSMPDQGLIEVPGKGIKSSIVDVTKKVGEEQSKNILGDLPKLIKDNLSKVGLGNNLVTGLLVGGLGAGALMGNMTEEEVLDVDRGEGLDLEGIRTEVLTAMKDPTGEALKAIRVKYPFLGNRDTKDIDAMGKAMGGRIGFSKGKLAPVTTGLNYLMDLFKPKPKVIFDEKRFREGPVTADFLENIDKKDLEPFIRSRDMSGPGGSGLYDNLADMPAGLQAAELINRIKGPRNTINYEAAEMFIGKKLKGNESVNELIEMLIEKKAEGGRIGMAGGGIMDLSGMEKDYRNTGGFVDIGEYEKKDDVPARLSVNEFVMTADAVRGMGNGDIDLGAKRMENLMGSMENKKGAQQMFNVSERLSEVI